MGKLHPLPVVSARAQAATNVFAGQPPQKEEVLFGCGIKCLSLFFIDEVAKYRTYDADGGPGLGGYGRML